MAVERSEITGMKSNVHLSKFEFVIFGR